MQDTRWGGSGNSSSSSGYMAGARTGASSLSSKIEKFPFVSGGNTTSNANLTNGGSNYVGYSSSTDGYTYGGETAPNGAVMLKTDKFSFASDTDSTDLGSVNSVQYIGGCQSSDSGFLMGGRNPPTSYLTTIRKFAFASDTTLSDHSDLNTGVSGATGVNSDVNGYSINGSFPGSPYTHSNIDKFPFASQTNATEVGEVDSVTYGMSGSSSTQSGYTAGGQPGPSQKIRKFPFASDGNAADVGNLASGTVSVTSAQY